MSEFLLILTLLALPAEATPCSLDILVQDSLGPLPGAIVLLFHKYDEPSAYVANSNGRVTITDLPRSPDYFVGAQFPGYKIVTEATKCPRPSDDPLALTLRLDSSYKFQESPSEHRQEKNLLIVNTPTDNSYPKPSCVLVKVMKLDQKGLLLEREPGEHLPPTARDITRFESIEPGMPLEDVYTLVGPPDYRTDSGKHYDVYLLDSCWEVWISSEDSTVLSRDYHDPSGKIRPIAN